MSALEKKEEAKFGKWVRKMDGRYPKIKILGPYGTTGEPDRMTLLPLSVLIFMEFKRLGKEPTPLQANVHKHYRRLGQKVYVVFSASEAQAIAEKKLRLAIQRMDPEALSEAVHRLRTAEARRWILSCARSRQDVDHSVHLQDSSTTRRRRRTVRVGITKNRVRRLAARNKEVEVRIQDTHSAWKRESERIRRRR